MTSPARVLEKSRSIPSENSWRFNNLAILRQCSQSSFKSYVSFTGFCERVMPRSFTSQKISTAKLRHRGKQYGYILITLMLTLALMGLALLAVLPNIARQIQRDREEELCHRGDQYMRAIQHYYRRLGRYPTRIEDLENTNNVRYLRKRYKDPMSRDPQTGLERDFKLLHMEDVLPNNGPMLGQSPGQTLGLQSPNNRVAISNNSAPSNPANVQGDANADSSGAEPTTNDSSSTGEAADENTQLWGGGVILGVASASKQKTIREFNNKNHYSEWYFIYDSTAPVLGLLKGPWQASSLPGGGKLGQPIAEGEAGASGVSQSQSTAAPSTRSEQISNESPPNN
jgi:type II secretory pathway pseudopilin PulG